MFADICGNWTFLPKGTCANGASHTYWLRLCSHANPTLLRGKCVPWAMLTRCYPRRPCLQRPFEFYPQSQLCQFGKRSIPFNISIYYKLYIIILYLQFLQRLGSFTFRGPKTAPFSSSGPGGPGGPEKVFRWPCGLDRNIKEIQRVKSCHVGGNLVPLRSLRPENPTLIFFGCTGGGSHQCCVNCWLDFCWQ